jgi:uncharacterized membrane protein SpoIIM required for sporulation
MKQQLFEDRNKGEWSEFEACLPRPERKRNAVLPKAGAAPDDAEFPARYRRLCQQLALARDRQYSADLVDRLNRLALRGHALLYGARDDRKNRAFSFIAGGFSRLVRAEWQVVAVAGALFFGPLLALILVLQFQPDFVYYLMNPQQIANFEEMYSPTAARLGRTREADSSFLMFGVYIWNNIKIGFQTFAGGLLFGLGTIFFLFFNGFLLGAVAGHLTQIGYVTPFYSFVSGHSALELTAIMLSGAAGLKIGFALIAPGQFSRKAAVMQAARAATRIVYGAAAMFLAAAFVEAFWSPLTEVPVGIKYGVGIAMWLAVAAYFVFAGRGRGA